MQRDELLEALRQLAPAERQALMDQVRSETPQTIPRIFMSYSRDDVLFARDLMAGLEKGGIRVWFDVRELLVGEDYRMATEKGLRECSHCLVVVSPYSMKSPEVARELAIADRVGTPILPVILQDSVLPEALGYLQWIDFRFQFDAPLFALITQLHGRTAPGLSEQRFQSARKPLLAAHGFVPLFQRSAPTSVHLVNGLIFTGAVALIVPMIEFMNAKVVAASGILLVYFAVMIRTAFRVAERRATRTELRSELATYLFLVPAMTTGFLALLGQRPSRMLIWSGIAYGLLNLTAFIVSESGPDFGRRLRAREAKTAFLPAWLRVRGTKPLGPTARQDTTLS